MLSDAELPSLLLFLLTSPAEVTCGYSENGIEHDWIRSRQLKNAIDTWDVKNLVPVSLKIS